MRGLANQEAELAETLQKAGNTVTESNNPYKVYDLPFQHILNRYNILSKIPMCPSYKETKIPSLPTCRKRKADKAEE